MLFDDAAAESEAQSGSTEGAGIRGISLLEALEDVFQFPRRNTAAMIFNDEADFAGREEIA